MTWQGDEAVRIRSQRELSQEDVAALDASCGATRLRRECAWCGKHLGYKDGQGQTGVTHSICPECRRKALAI